MNNSSEDISLSLLANPQHIKKKDTNNIKKDNLIDDKIISLITKRFPNIVIKDVDKQHILKKIESFCNDYTINTIIEEELYKLVTSVIIDIENGT
tara:strand:- start:570 stop:854 length:285 start_codon:yes stop_codon:yes gene_type:complete